eukprot:809658-Pleurochrysis_carterae.AAC.3
MTEARGPSAWHACASEDGGVSKRSGGRRVKVVEAREGVGVIDYREGGGEDGVDSAGFCHVRPPGVLRRPQPRGAGKADPQRLPGIDARRRLVVESGEETAQPRVEDGV